MGRKNSKVRQRNLPRAAQRQPKSTQRAQLPAREDWGMGRQPTKLDRADREILMVDALYSQRDSEAKLPL